MEFQILLISALVVYTLLSLVSIVLFAIDKRAAQSHSRRIPEVTLHTIEALGGWPGSFLAMRYLRHKSAKHRYRLITILIMMGHLVAWVAVFLPT